MKPVRKNKFVLVAMTLVEVLVALAIVSFVFSSLTQMTFDALKRTKKLELQDKMRNYATEAVQIVYTAKNVNWQGGGGFTEILPAATTSEISQVYVNYDDLNGSRLLELTQVDCAYDTQKRVLVGASCDITIPPESVEKNKIFGRIVQRLDNNQTDFGENEGSDTVNDAEINIIVACIEGFCEATEYPPFVLNFVIYRTGAAQ